MVLHNLNSEPMKNEAISSRFLPIHVLATRPLTGQVTEQVLLLDDIALSLLDFCIEPRSRKAIQKYHVSLLEKACVAPDFYL